MAVTGKPQLSQIQRATSWNPYFWVTVLNILSCEYFTSVKSLVWMTHKSLCLLHLTNSQRTNLVLLVNRRLNISFYLVTDYYYLWSSISVTKILTTFLTYYADHIQQQFTYDRLLGFKCCSISADEQFSSSKICLYFLLCSQQLHVLILCAPF